MEDTQEKNGIDTVCKYFRHAPLLLGFFAALFLVLSSTPSAYAATLYFSPTTGSHTVGSTFTVGIYVSSPGQSMNAASGEISSPSNSLQVVSLSEVGSIMNLWVQNPSFSNSVGTVDFQGIVLSPGFTGSNEKVLDVTFKVKAAGTAPLTFQSGSVLANDGNGTDILTGFGSAKFALGTSIYAAPPIVNTPSFSITEVTSTDPTNPKATFAFNVEGDNSAIDHYQIQIDNGAPIIWHDDGTHLYTTPAIYPGQHSIIVKAFDVAGNELADSANFTIAPLNPPKIENFPAQLNSGNALVIKGETDYPGAEVLISLQNENSNSQQADLLGMYQSGSNPNVQSVTADQQGNFTLVWAGSLNNGIYEMSAEVVDSEGGRSIPTTPIAMAINPSVFFTIGSWTVSFFSLAVPLAALVIVLVFMLWYAWHKFRLFRKKLKKELGETEGVISGHIHGFGRRCKSADQITRESSH